MFNEICFEPKSKCPHHFLTTFIQQYNNHNSITIQKHQNITCKLKYIHRKKFLLIEMRGLHTAVSFS